MVPACFSSPIYYAPSYIHRRFKFFSPQILYTLSYCHPAYVNKRRAGKRYLAIKIPAAAFAGESTTFGSVRESNVDCIHASAKSSAFIDICTIPRHWLFIRIEIARGQRRSLCLCLFTCDQSQQSKRAGGPIYTEKNGKFDSWDGVMLFARLNCRMKATVKE